MSDDPRWEMTRYLVEATTFEHSVLATSSEVSWADDIFWIQYTAGYLAGYPVTYSVSWATVDGVLIAFFCAESSVVDHDMIETDIKKRARNHTGITDAMNFHHCLKWIASRH
jgi:hypothetical protein